MCKTLKGGSHRLLALFLAVITVFSLLSTTAFAAQEDNYHDPADHSWAAPTSLTPTPP